MKTLKNGIKVSKCVAKKDHRIMEGNAKFLRRLTGYLRDYEREPDLTLSRVSYEVGCEKGVNFMSEITRLATEGALGDRRGYKKSFIMKQPLVDPVLRENLQADEAFKNELRVYQVVLPALQTEHFPWPKLVAADERYLILEDLKENHFRMAQHKDGLDLDHCNLVIKEIARFHARSVLLKQNNPPMFDALSKSLRHIVLSENGRRYFKEMLEVSFSRALDSYKPRTGNTSNATLTALEGFKGKIFDLMHEMSKANDTYAVICHGDLWMNNLLFSYDKNGIVMETRMLDFQGSSLAHPCTDLMRFLYTSTTSKMRKTHLENFLKLYQKTIIEELRRGSRIISETTNANCEPVHLPNGIQKHPERSLDSNSNKSLQIKNNNDINAETIIDESKHEPKSKYGNWLHSETSFIKGFCQYLDYDKFYKEFRCRSMYGFVTAVWLLPVITLDVGKEIFSSSEERLRSSQKNSCIELNDAGELNIEFGKENKPLVEIPSEKKLREMLCNEAYHEKVKELIEEYADNGWLNDEGTMLDDLL